jgi:hypothetical protein
VRYSVHVVRYCITSSFSSLALATIGFLTKRFRETRGGVSLNNVITSSFRETVRNNMSRGGDRRPWRGQKAVEETGGHRGPSRGQRLIEKTESRREDREQ